MPLGFKTCQHDPAVHSNLDTLDSHLAFHRRSLFGDPDFAHAAFTNPLQQLVPPCDHRSGNHGFWLGVHFGAVVMGDIDRRLQKPTHMRMSDEQLIHLAAKLPIATTG